MARIRSIKPDFWTDEKLVEEDPWVRLLFIGLWNFADDEGYLPYSPKRIKMQVFPAETLEVSRGLQRLIFIGALTLYDSPEGQVIRVTNWEKHQKVSNPSKSKYRDLPLTPVTQKPRNHADFEPENTEPSPNSTEPSRELCKEKEREGEREREGVLPLRTYVTSAELKKADPRNRALRIIHDWVDQQEARPPGKVIADATIQVQALCSEGIPDEQITAGLSEWWQGRYPASVIANYVANVRHGRGTPQATGTKRAADILAIDTSSIPT